jgi:hypothetical protein
LIDKSIQAAEAQAAESGSAGSPDMAWFDGHLYVSSQEAVYRLTDDGLQVVKVKGVKTFGYLSAADGVLWSFGIKDVAWTMDRRWPEVDARGSQFHRYVDVD